jgi:ABC-type phosphate transport system substrate-binding protein
VAGKTKKGSQKETVPYSANGSSAGWNQKIQKTTNGGKSEGFSVKEGYSRLCGEEMGYE